MAYSFNTHNLKSKNAAKEAKYSLTRRIEGILSQQHAQTGLTVAQMLERMGDKSLGLLLVLIAFAGAIPMPATGYSTPFGFILLLLSFQLLGGRKTPWLPKCLLKLHLSSKILKGVLSYSALACKKIEPWVHPRLPWVCSCIGRTVMAILMIILSIILILPIPFMNTAPCLLMCLMALGFTQDDGLFLLLSTIVAAVATAIFFYISYIFYTVGLEGLTALQDRLLALL